MLCLLLAACPAPGTKGSRSSPPQHAFELGQLAGSWRWTLRTTEASTTRVETEDWQFRHAPGRPNVLLGRYLRTLEVRSNDGVPFQCNQRLVYRQRAVYDLDVQLAGEGFAIRELEVRAEPSPCDHGFRKTAGYAAQLNGNRLILRWAGDKPGTQTLWQIDHEDRELAPDPWPAKPTLAGVWRWDARSYDDDGNVREEHEWWHLTARGERNLDGTYRRQVIVQSRDGSPIPCAKLASWTFDDGYVLEGETEEEHWHLHERAAEPGDHACLRPTPRRTLDEATAEQLGDYLLLEWRGKRRQVLYRPEPVGPE
ncbi:MAG: hypothetical protein WKG01_20555 [Kofleriaceae bacterium]